MSELGWLDLRLMLSRQPLVASIFGAIVVLAGVLLMQPPDSEVISSSAGPDPARILAAQRSFRGTLIAPSALAGAQQAVLEAAASHRLGLGAVEYAREPDSVGGFDNASMRFTVTGSYTDLRGFAAAILNSQTAVSIRHLSLRREFSDGLATVNGTFTVQFLVGEAIR